MRHMLNDASLAGGENLLETASFHFFPLETVAKTANLAQRDAICDTAFYTRDGATKTMSLEAQNNCAQVESIPLRLFYVHYNYRP